MDDPKKAVFGGMILGSPIFIKEALGRLKDVAFQHEEISQGRELRSALTIEDILMALCGYFDILPLTELCQRKIG